MKCCLALLASLADHESQFQHSGTVLRHWHPKVDAETGIRHRPLVLHFCPAQSTIPVHGLVFEGHCCHQ
jgi:hypothetical protein